MRGRECHRTTAMKLHPPKAIVDRNEPFKEALFGRREFAESLTSLLRNAEDNLVIFVHAPWGEGKTTFAEMWRAHLANQKLDVIYFDAYAVDYIEDPFVSFSGEILALADKHLAKETGKPARREFKKTAVEVGKRLGGLATKIAIRAATMGAVKASDVDELKEIGAEAATGVSEIGAAIIEKKIENYTAEKDSLAEFKNSLAKLAKLFRDEYGFPLTIIVDELDRCRPDFALSLLERIKHLFDVNGIAFILLVNRDQIESYIRTVYGEVDPRAYLLKFGNLFVDLPNQQGAFTVRHEPGRKEFCKKLFNHHEFSKRVGEEDDFANSVGVFADHFDLTLREIEKVFVLLAIYYGALTKNEYTEGYLVAILAILKIKHPPIYQSLRRGKISVEQFLQRTALDQVRIDNEYEINKEWLKNIISYSLMSDSEFENAMKNDDTGLKEMGRWVRIKRGKIVPLLCSKLDRFSTQA